uniref:Uncharacterized protein n=1 Tax=Acrobeloides nanus TaxID=290746 RepID=A0A914CK63_9BILA
MSKNSSSYFKDNENRRNRKLIVQNIINLTAAVIILVPSGLYSLSACRDYNIGPLVYRGHLAIEYWNSRFLTNNAFYILQTLSRKSTLRIVGHALEE